jgi:hypothetical protein
LPAHAVNAYYDLLGNQLVIPAGFLQPPLFDAQADAAVNFGALGALVGRELMHGFDVIGSTIDAEGTPAAGRPRRSMAFEYVEKVCVEKGMPSGSEPFPGGTPDFTGRSDGADG